jgi:ubiquinone/menaquinone biosynthesis C-methylase UbiE
MKKQIKYISNSIIYFAPKKLKIFFKNLNEILYWRTLYNKKDKTLDNTHIKYFFTNFFELSTDFYFNKKVIDIGCGPIGTLEWADMAYERIGIDPLVEKYSYYLNIRNHKMKYINAKNESIPYPECYFDIVTSFNSLDHVDNLDLSIQEIKRVCKINGSILIIVEINHKPTITEPIQINTDITNKFQGCKIINFGTCRIREDHDIYASLIEKLPLSSNSEPGLMWVHFLKYES